MVGVDSRGPAMTWREEAAATIARVKADHPCASSWALRRLVHATLEYKDARRASYPTHVFQEELARLAPLVALPPCGWCGGRAWVEIGPGLGSATCGRCSGSGQAPPIRICVKHTDCRDSDTLALACALQAASARLRERAEREPEARR